MNKKIGLISSVANLISVLLFALSMIIKSNNLGYFSSMFIAFSFVVMMTSLANKAPEDRKVAAKCGMLFSATYAVIILLVYFTQLTTVRFGGLTEQASKILNYQQMGLFFSYDLLGYALMALSTFFIGLTIRPKTKVEKWLKWLLIIHGVFFISCIICPILGVFNTSAESSLLGVCLLEFWCGYFSVVGVLSIIYFKNYQE